MIEYLVVVDGTAEPVQRVRAQSAEAAITFLGAHLRVSRGCRFRFVTPYEADRLVHARDLAEVQRHRVRL